MISTADIAKFPNSPGVYLMKGANGTVLYVGKARNLRQRVRSYFGNSRDSRYQIKFLVEKVSLVEYIVTDTEKEALLLENTLIKKHRPKYNINLRDDKTYFSLRLDLTEELPRLNIVRKISKDNATYFGPYASATAARSVLKQLSRLFPLRHYQIESCRKRKRPCLFYQIGQCSAPCHGLISPAEYHAIAEGVALFLSGKDKELVRRYKEKMKKASEAENFEAAARYRDLIKDIEVTLEKQKMVTQGGDLDIIGYFRDLSMMTIAIMFIRGGVLSGTRIYHFDWALTDEDAIESFIVEYYSSDKLIPAEILVPLKLVEPEAVIEMLGEKSGRKCLLTIPKRGIKDELLSLAAKNAEIAQKEHLSNEKSGFAILTDLKEKLGLSSLPRRIECYDISNLQAGNAVGSRVVFIDGKEAKDYYRRYRIRDVAQQNDFAMMSEVLSRRVKRRDNDPLPDLIIVDGGLGQLGILVGVLQELGIGGVEAAALAKSRVKAAPEEAELNRSDERIFRPGRKNPIVLRQNSRPLLLLAAIRDEAHRFAVTYHQHLREKSTFRSLLEDIPGIGTITSRALLRRFGSLTAIAETSAEEVSAVRGVIPEVAETIINFAKSTVQSDRNN